MNASKLAAAILMTTSASVGFGMQKPATEPVDGLITWTYDYEEGQLASRTSGKPMFVVFRCER